MSTPPSIAILTTPPGVAAIAVVRLRGPAVQAFLKSHFSKTAQLGRCVHANLMDGDRVIDDAVVVLCDPATADINVHGGPWVVRSLLDLVVREGFELLDNTLPIQPQIGDALSPLDREIESYLPMAKTELGVRTLLAQANAWRNLGSDELPEILADQTLVHLLNPPSVAIIGPANVGKSTLANQLFSQERSITADVPGTTRDWVGEIANIEGLPVLLLDTPGLRQTHDPIEAHAIDQSRRRIASASLVVLVLDATLPLSGQQQQLRHDFPDALTVLNKTDKPVHAEFNDLAAIRTVATTGQGVDQLRSAVVRHFCGKLPVDPHRPRCWTDRQRKILRRAVTDPGALQALFADPEDTTGRI